VIRLPHWIENEPDQRRRNILENRFRLRLAALYASPGGTLEDLAHMIGIHPKTLRSQAQSVVRASERTKEGIRQILGDDFVPPDFPELYRKR